MQTSMALTGLTAARRTLLQGGRAAVIACALVRNRELQQRLRAGLASLNKASSRLADLRTQVESLKVKYKGVQRTTRQRTL